MLHVRTKSQSLAAEGMAQGTWKLSRQDQVSQKKLERGRQMARGKRDCEWGYVDKLPFPSSYPSSHCLSFGVGYTHTHTHAVCLVWFFKIWSHYVAQAGLGTSCFSFPSTEIIGLCQYACPHISTLKSTSFAYIKQILLKFLSIDL